MTPTRASLRVGRGTEVVELPREIVWDLLETAGPVRDALDAAAIAAALDTPTVGPEIADVLDGARAVTIAIPDRTRLAGLSQLLPVVLDRVASALPGDVPIRIVTGGGTHAPDALADAIGHRPDHLTERVEVGTHDARDAAAHVDVGTTRAGTHIALDRRVVEGEPVVIVVGAIGFHYFAGFTGGRKGIFPGLGAYESVRQNHRLVLDEDGPGLHPACRPGSLEGNPVHEDMLDAIRLVPGRVFLVNAICDDRGRVADVYTGDVIAAHRAGCDAYARAHTRSRREMVDVLLIDAGGHPRDIDLVQTHKSLVHASPALRPGGTLILRAACTEGIGSTTLAPWFDEGDAAAIERALRASYQLNSHTALSLRRCAQRHDLVMVTSLSRTLVERMGARAASSVAEALGAAVRGGARTGLVITAPTSVRLRTPEVSA